MIWPYWKYNCRVHKTITIHAKLSIHICPPPARPQACWLVPIRYDNNIIIHIIRCSWKQDHLVPIHTNQGNLINNILYTGRDSMAPPPVSSQHFPTINALRFSHNCSHTCYHTNWIIFNIHTHSIVNTDAILLNIKHAYTCVQRYKTISAYLNNSFLYISAVPQDSCTMYTTLKLFLLN